MKLPERYLYHIWDARHFVPELTTISQKNVKILFPGHFNTNAGPDYHHAVIEINGVVIQGDIEIHCKTSDWIAHQHHEDPIYNNVILHVVYEHNLKQKYTITEKGKVIDILEMKSFLDNDISKLTPPSLPIPDREPLCQFFAGLEPEQTKIILNHFGNERLQRRISRFQAELHFNDIDQLIYQSLMEAMGYKQNQFPFLILAEQLPFRQLQQWKRDGMTIDEMTSIFLCSSGLISSIKQEEENQYWLSTFRKQRYFKQYIPDEWNLFRIRPAHHPWKRIQLIRNFLYRALDQKLIELIHPIFLNHTNTKAQSVENALSNVINECSLANPVQGIFGKTMMRLLLINALIPIEMIHARRLKNNCLLKYLGQLYYSYPSLPENAQVRDMKRLMTISQVKQLNGSALRQLGLQQIYRQNCMIHDCKSCLKQKVKIIASM